MRDDQWPALTWESPPTSRHITIISALIPLTALPYCRTVTQPNLRNTRTDTDTAAGRRVAAAECSEVAGAELIILLKIFSHFLPARRQLPTPAPALRCTVTMDCECVDNRYGAVAAVKLMLSLRPANQIMKRR